MASTDLCAVANGVTIVTQYKKFEGVVITGNVKLYGRDAPRCAWSPCLLSFVETASRCSKIWLQPINVKWVGRGRCLSYGQIYAQMTGHFF